MEFKLPGFSVMHATLLNSCECSVNYVGVLVDKGVVLFIGVLESLFDHFWRSVWQSPFFEAECAHRHKSSI